MDLTQLKAQVMAMFAIRQSQGQGHGHGQSQSNQNDVFFLLYTLIIMTLVERAFKVAPQVLDSLWNGVTRYAAKKAIAASNLLPTANTSTPELSSITLRRSYESSTGKPATEIDTSLEKVDGVLEHICSLDAARHIKLDKRYVLHNKEEIAVTPHIRAKITAITMNETGELKNLEIVVSSEKLGINELRAWVDEIHRNYCFEKNNQLGGKKYYFNEGPMEPMQELMPYHGPQGNLCNLGNQGDQPAKKNYRWDSAPKTLTFTMNEFHTAKSFRNVFGAHVAELKERLDLFVNHPDWYQARGIPHSLGILLHGIPGAGKTSTIKAVAKDTGRHIFNLSLRPYTTQKQLTHLFFNENVAVVGEDGVRQTYRIPLNQRVYVIEDIDCLTDIVYQRTAEGSVDPNGDAVTLSFLLNLLDGVLETPGRILIITTNHPEKLDKALVRPGRIDVNIRFQHASRALIGEMYTNFYGSRVGAVDVPVVLEDALTPAEVLECFCNNFKDPAAAMRQLLKRAELRCGTALEDLLIAEHPAAVDPMKQSMYISPSNVSFTVSEVAEEEESSNTSESSQSSQSQPDEVQVNAFLQSLGMETRKVYSPHVVKTKTTTASISALVYKPIDVTVNPKEKYGESGDHPKPHGGTDELWGVKDINEFYSGL